MTNIVVFGARKNTDVCHSIALADRNVSLGGFTCDREFITARELRSGLESESERPDRLAGQAFAHRGRLAPSAD